MSSQTTAEQALAGLLVETLNLESVDATGIDPMAPLFGHNTGGLGLDSIDALEIALMVQQHYGVELRSDDPDTQKIFATLRALTAHVESRRKA